MRNVYVHGNTAELTTLLLVPSVVPPRYAIWLYHLQLLLACGNLWDSPFSLAFLDSHSLAAAAALKLCKTQFCYCIMFSGSDQKKSNIGSLSSVLTRLTNVSSMRVTEHFYIRDNSLP